MSKYGTPFVQTEALVAVGNEDHDTAEDILRSMLPGELARLRQNAEELAGMCESIARAKRREAADR